MSNPDRTRTDAHADPVGTQSFADTAGTPLPASASPPATTGRYELGDEIARGGMGVVVHAFDTVLGRKVAVKILHDKYAPESGTAHRFADEARITAQLQHPNIPAVHDLGTLPDGRPFLAMKLIKGDTLEELLKQRPDPAADRGRFVAVFEQVCQAVAYAHAYGVIHRDLKPANVMVGAFAEVQVMDWGLAKVLTGRERERPPSAFDETSAGTAVISLRDSDDQFTQAGSVLGTPAFMPPEQAVGAVGKIDARSDVFGLGGVLAVILSGAAPFAAGSAETTRVRAATGDVGECFARLDASGADPEWVALCKRCLSPKPDDRPADAGVVAAAVAALRAAADERARRAELDRVLAAEKAAAQRKRRRALTLLAVAAGLLVVAGGAVGWHADRAAGERRAVEQARQGRNAEAVGGSLDQAEAALRAGDAGTAALALESADTRAAEGGADEHADRREKLKADLAVMRELDATDRFRWTTTQSKYPAQTSVAARYRAVLVAFGADPDATDPATVAARITGSAARDQLVAALDWMLRQGESARVRAVLRAADPDVFRDAVRDAVIVSDGPAMATLAARPEAAEQPPRFVAFIAASNVVAAERKQALLTAAVRRRPSDLGLFMALGTAYWRNETGSADERVRWYQAAVAVAPGNPAAHSNLGNALYDKGEYAAAIASYREAIRLDPQGANAHILLGDVLHQKEENAAAIASYREAVRLEPDNIYAHVYLGNVLNATGERGAALADYREAVRLYKNFLANSSTLPRYDAAGRAAAVVAGCRENVRLAPQDVVAHLRLGDALNDAGDHVAAAASYREATRLDPTSAWAQAKLIGALARAGDAAGAAAVQRELTRLHPRDPVFHYRIGVALRDLGRAPEADVALREAVRQDGDRYGSAIEALADLLAAGGQLVEAVVVRKEIVRLRPGDEGSRRNLAQDERTLELIRRLPNVLSGKAEPTTPAEALEFARLCAQPHQNRNAAAARLFDRAFTADPKLATAPGSVDRYNAACAAALAARGSGVDAPAAPADRAALRAKALMWLRAEIVLHAKRAASNDPDERKAAGGMLSRWLDDLDLVKVRELHQLSALPTDEATEWLQLWGDVYAAYRAAYRPAK